LLKDSYVSIRIFDISGREVQTLVNEFKTAGTHNVIFDVTGRRNLASGVYFYKLQAGDFTDVKKMILVK
jgi:hypothetical protein